LGRVELAPLRRIPVALPRRERLECVQPDLLAWRGEHPANYLGLVTHVQLPCPGCAEACRVEHPHMHFEVCPTQAHPAIEEDASKTSN
jgi:hypothetical protein